MRTLFALLVIGVVGLFAEPLKVNVSAKSAILMNAETGAILYEKKGRERMYPASLTKIATTLYAIKKNREGMEEEVPCLQHCLRKMNKSVKLAHSYKDPAYFLEPDGLHFWIKRGEKIAFKDLLYGMMLASGNDAANVTAHHVGGTIPKFMDGLNGYLKELGCKDTYFSNPHGLHHPSHKTTAYDLALIAKEALKNEVMRSIITTKEYERGTTNLQTPKKITNRNPLIQPGRFFYSRAIGMKTGYHSDAGYTYASVARDGNRTLIAILLGCDSRPKPLRDAIRLFEAAFEEEKEDRLLFNKEENVFSLDLKRGKETLKAALLEDVAISYYPSEEPQITIELNWEYVIPPIKKGKCVGSINILDPQNNVLETVPLVAIADVNQSAGALLGAALQGNWDCPKEFQRILILFLSFGLLLTLFTIYRVERKPKS